MVVGRIVGWPVIGEWHSINNQRNKVKNERHYKMKEEWKEWIAKNYIPAAILTVMKNLLASKLANSSILYWPSSPARFIWTESQKEICSKKYELKILFFKAFLNNAYLWDNPKHHLQCDFTSPLIVASAIIAIVALKQVLEKYDFCEVQNKRFS